VAPTSGFGLRGVSVTDYQIIYLVLFGLSILLGGVALYFGTRGQGPGDGGQRAVEKEKRVQTAFKSAAEHAQNEREKVVAEMDRLAGGHS
jgi:hypothetical protein